MRNHKQEVLDLINASRYTVFYGTGSHFNGVMDYWHEYMRFDPDFCCDSNPKYWGHDIRNIPCISPEDLFKFKDDAVIFITTRQYKEIQEFLAKNGVKNIHVLPWLDIQNADKVATMELDSMVVNLCEAFRLLEDDKSRLVFCTIIERVLGGGFDVTHMASVCEGDQYYPKDLIQLTDHESFVDCGAYDGDTIRDFQQRTGNKFESIRAFELNTNNFTALRKSIPYSGNIHPYNFGVSDKAEEITYQVSDSPATKIGEGKGKGVLTVLDNILYGEKVTMIKMDIEGYELKALMGAKQIIKEQKPKLAICAYHTFSHLWEIPLLIKSLNPDYKIYLRHHTNLDCETVCYAI